MRIPLTFRCLHAITCRQSLCVSLTGDTNMLKSLLIVLGFFLFTFSCKDDSEPAHALDGTKWMSLDSLSPDSLHYLLLFTSDRMFWYLGPLPCYDEMELLLNVRSDTIYVGLLKNDEVEESPDCSFFLYEVRNDTLIMTLGTMDGCIRTPRGASPTSKFIKTRFSNLELCSEPPAKSDQALYNKFIR